MGTIRIGNAASLLRGARVKLTTMWGSRSGRLLPVEPIDQFPLNAIKEVAERQKFNKLRFTLTVGNYNVEAFTPLVKSWIENRRHATKARQKANRTRNRRGVVQGTFKSLQDLKNWRKYAGEYQPLIQVEARP